jgi:hypothetical protein
MIDHATIAKRITATRLGSYLDATDGDLVRALELYDWNAAVGGALHEDIGRIEVVFRNTIDSALLALGASKGWPTPWYRRRQLFPGRHGARALDDIGAARSRATRARTAETHGKVIAELSLGFWRYLCTTQYLTSLWVPALADAFSHHPRRSDARAVRRDVEDRIQRIHFLRNRIAHHEPIHTRDLDQDVHDIVELSGWICPATGHWVATSSRVSDLLPRR